MKTLPADRTFKAFADETRLRILSLLSLKGELCVCDLMAVLKMGQSKISRHLAYLKKAGLAKDRKDGLWSHYSLTPPKSKLHKQILNCLDHCFDEVSILKRDAEALKRNRIKEAACKSYRTKK